MSADNKKADRVVILDIREESEIADYIVIAGAHSAPQMRALLDSIEEDLGPLGAKALRREGRPGNRWLVLDFGGLLVHIFLSEAREFYRLESLWPKAKTVRWTPE